MKAVKAANPDLGVRFVFQTPYNKIYKGSEITYAKWAEKHGKGCWPCDVGVNHTVQTGSESEFVRHLP